MWSTTFPQAITHEKVLVDCDTEWNNFLATMDVLGAELGPLLFQFGLFKQSEFKNVEEFLARLKPFLRKLPNDHRFAAEIRNKNWLDACFADTLREHNVALALTDQSWMPRNLKVFVYANNHYALCRRRHNAYNAAFRIMPN